MTTDSTSTRFVRADPGHLDEAGLAWWIDVDVTLDASVNEFLDALDADRVLDRTIVSRIDLADQRRHLLDCPHCQASLNPLQSLLRTALTVQGSISEPERAASLVAATNAFLSDVHPGDTPVVGTLRKSWKQRLGFGNGTGVSPGSLSSSGGLGALRPRVAVPLVLSILAATFVAIALRGSHSPMLKSALDTARSTETDVSATTVQPRVPSPDDALADAPRAAAAGAPATEAASAAESAAESETAAQAVATEAAAFATAAAARSGAADRATSETQSPEVSADDAGVQPQTTQPGPVERPASKRARADVSTTIVPTNASIPPDPPGSAAELGSVAPSGTRWLGELGGFPDVATARAAASERGAVLGIFVPVVTTATPHATSNPIATTAVAPAAVSPQAAPTTAAPSATTSFKASEGLPSSPCLSDDVRAWASAHIGQRQVVIVVRSDVDDVVVLDASTCRPIT